jgi:probable selenium-dependent hydroxylase accessory protein YqeC
MTMTREDFAFKERELIAVTGGGGKTSLVFHLASLFARDGLLATTTTHLCRWDIPSSLALQVAEASDLIEALPGVLSEGPLLAARAVAGDKLQGFAPDEVDRFYRDRRVRKVVVEADGARGFPVKGYADHEPVIPSMTTCHIVVVGAELFLRPLDERTVFRLPLFLEASGLAEGTWPTASELARVLSSERIYLKGSPRGVRRLLVVNKADLFDERGRRLLAETARQLEGYDGIFVTRLRRDDDGHDRPCGRPVAEDG